MRMSRTAVLCVILPMFLACDDKKAGTTAPSASATASSDKAGPLTAWSSAAGATVQVPLSDVPTAVPSANLTMKETSLDGFRMKVISCKVPTGNSFMAMTKLAPLAKQRTALDACVDKPAEISIQFNVVDKKTKDTRVAGAPTTAAAACIATAVDTAPWDEPMTCVVKFDLKTVKQ